MHPEALPPRAPSHPWCSRPNPNPNPNPDPDPSPNPNPDPNPDPNPNPNPDPNPNPYPKQVLAPAAERAARATAAAHPEHRNGLVSWLHIPKCGSSFVAAVAGAFCPSLPAEHLAELGLGLGLGLGLVTLALTLTRCLLPLPPGRALVRVRPQRVDPTLDALTHAAMVRRRGRGRGRVMVRVEGEGEGQG